MQILIQVSITLVLKCSCGEYGSERKLLILIAIGQLNRFLIFMTWAIILILIQAYIFIYILVEMNHMIYFCHKFIQNTHQHIGSGSIYIV